MFSKAWILPDGTPVQLGGKWHHEWLNENGEQYGIKTGADDPSARTEALKKGFARMNYARNGGQLTVEARAADWAKLKPSIQQFVELNFSMMMSAQSPTPVLRGS
jgi:tRNA threonylcarbamoyladenosine modification (KEOPS) complex  Pcc1 subunit